MSDPNVQRWRQRGDIFLWRYRDRPRNYPGWHLSATPAGAESLLQLLRMMCDAPYSSERVIRIADPTHAVLAVPNYTHGYDQWQSAHRWRLRYSRRREDVANWKIVFTGRELEFTLGEKYVLALIRGIENLIAGKGDYAISSGRADEHDCLWFWWWTGAA